MTPYCKVLPYYLIHPDYDHTEHQRKAPHKRHADSSDARRSDIVNYVGEELFARWIPLMRGYSRSMCVGAVSAGWLCMWIGAQHWLFMPGKSPSTPDGFAHWSSLIGMRIQRDERKGEWERYRARKRIVAHTNAWETGAEFPSNRCCQGTAPKHSSFFNVNLVLLKFWRCLLTFCPRADHDDLLFWPWVRHPESRQLWEEERLSCSSPPQAELAILLHP